MARKLLLGREVLLVDIILVKSPDEDGEVIVGI